MQKNEKKLENQYKFIKTSWINPSLEKKVLNGFSRWFKLMKLLSRLIRADEISYKQKQQQQHKRNVR